MIIQMCDSKKGQKEKFTAHPQECGFEKPARNPRGMHDLYVTTLSHKHCNPPVKVNEWSETKLLFKQQPHTIPLFYLYKPFKGFPPCLSCLIFLAVRR